MCVAAECFWGIHGSAANDARRGGRRRRRGRGYWGRSALSERGAAARQGQEVAAAATGQIRGEEEVRLRRHPQGRHAPRARAQDCERPRRYDQQVAANPLLLLLQSIPVYSYPHNSDLRLIRVHLKPPLHQTNVISSG